VTDYSNSHTAHGKGLSYETSFETHNYRKLVWQWEQETLDLIVATLSVDRPIGSYLDFACGTGRVTAHIEEKVESSTGVDVSESMLSVARQRLNRTTLVKANLLTDGASPLDGQSFDLISAFRFFLNAEPSLRAAAMQQLSSMLSPNGAIVFNNHLNRSSLRSIVTRAYTAVRHRNADRYPTMSRAEVEGLLADAGLQIDSVYPFGIWPTAHTERTRLPIRVHRKAEDILGSVPALQRFATYEIFVARPKN